MATIESHSDLGIGNDPIFSGEYSALFAQVDVTGEPREYYLEGVLAQAGSRRDALPIIHGHDLRTGDELSDGRETPLNFMNVMGVKLELREVWTPASAVFALSRTVPEFKRNRGKVVNVELIEDSVKLGVRPPRTT